MVETAIAQSLDTAVLNRKFAGSGTRAMLSAILAENRDRKIGLVSSFGAGSAVLLHLVAGIDRNLPVLFIDTGKLFPETKRYHRKLVKLLGLRDVRIATPLPSHLADEDPQGLLHRSNADQCCHIRKTLPLQTALSGFDAWISGRKRFHGGERSRLPTIEWLDGRVKIDPLAHYSRQEIADYISFHGRPTIR